MSHLPSERVFSKNWSLPKSWTLDVFQKNGGYEGLKKAHRSDPEDLIKEVIESNVRGRGGAGFPVGRKWSFVPKVTDKPKYVCVNADEGEPGTFKDRYILELDPHMLIEGTAICCKAVGAHHAFIYIRGEFGLAYERIEAAVQEAYAAGILGDSSMGHDFAIHMVVHRGAGAYICGEETALLESLEGKRGHPRLKPPFPAVEGLFGCPTVINNVESLAAVGPIIKNGAAWWKGLSKSEAEGGTKLIGVSGHVAKPGVYELPIGLTLRQLIYDVAGGMRNPDRPLKAIVPGGSSCKIVTPDQIDTLFDFDAMKTIDGMMGTGCPTIIEEGTCMVRLLRRLIRFYAHESCGQCTPCREGSDWLFKILDRLEEGRGSMGDIEMLERVASKIEGHTICALGEATAWPTRSYVATFHAEFVRHVEEGGCPFDELPVAPVRMSGDLPS